MPEDGQLRLAILYDKDSPYSPSNVVAIQRFLDAAHQYDIKAEIITHAALHRLPDFHSLFIRDTTHPENYTYEFALAAQHYGMKVLDSPEAILKGCNKIWQLDAFSKYKIPFPESWIITSANKERIINFITFPCVIKIPDSCFSQGVYLATDKASFTKLTSQLLAGSHSMRRLICQEFIKTRFDWRITLFQRKLLFVCKYYMVDDDWKIIKYDRQGSYIDGKHESISLEEIPDNIKEIAIKCLDFLDDGLYGIDIKQRGNDIYIIEINDNPSIDGGIEDEYYGMKIYNTIMKWFKK